MIIEQEFRNPLSTSLMFLENLLLSKNLTAATKQILMIIVSQINLLISLLNDALDMRLIEEGSFKAKR